jgi:predicted RecB family endonuclease
VTVKGTQIRINTPQNPSHRNVDILIERNRDGKRFAIEVKTGNAARDSSQLAKDSEIATGKGTNFSGRRARAAGFANGTPTGPIDTVESRPF